jgi:hypothetical protein
MGTILCGIIICAFAAFFGAVKSNIGQSTFASFVVYAIVTFVGVTAILFAMSPSYTSGYSGIFVPAWGLVLSIPSGIAGGVAAYLSRTQRPGAASAVRIFLLVLLIGFVLNFWK